MRELFVWYRVRADRAAATRAAVHAMQRSLMAAWPGLDARLLIRGAPDAPTWMETYARRAASPAANVGIDSVLEAAIEDAARPFAAASFDGRHAEAFDTVDPGDA